MAIRANSGTTRSRAVHEQLRSEIIGGVHAPGVPMRLAELSARFGVSMSVIREALIRLSEQNLVALSPNQGFRVVEVSRADLIELTELRVMLEVRALRDSIALGTPDWEAEIIAAHHLLEHATVHPEDELGASVEWSQAHTRFHDALGLACGNQRLIDLVTTLRDGSEIYRQLSIRQNEKVHRDVAGEHRDLMKLALERRTDDAVGALERHLRRTLDMFLALDGNW